MSVMQMLPVRMCVVVPMEDGTFTPYCIACHWQPKRPCKTHDAAEAKARRHTCRKRGQ